MKRVKSKIQMAMGDMGGPGASSPWKKFFMISGLGCAVLVLVGALFMGLGVFQIATCCADHGEKQNYLRSVGHRFGDAIQNGDYAGAYEMVHESKRETVGFEEFRQEFERYELEHRPPFPASETKHFQTGEQNRWRVQIPFAEPRSEEVVRVSLFVDDDHIDTEAWSPKNIFGEWEITTDQRPLADSDYADGAVRFYGFLRAREFDAARFLISRRGPLRERDQSELTEYLESLATDLDAIRGEEIYGLSPGEDGDTVRVTMLLTADDGAQYFQDYVITARSYMTRDVSQLRPTADSIPHSR